jgi:DNA-binding SARP family transcriptional activator
MKNRVRLAMLGPPDLWLDNQRIKLPTRKALALLTYLVVEGGRHPRDELAALLWPDGDGARARAALRNTLAYLRSALDAATDPLLPESGNGQRLVADRDTVSLHLAEDDEVDLDALRRAERAIRGIDLTPDTPLVAVLQNVLERNPGNFLQGFLLDDAPEFDDWINLQRDVNRRRLGLVYDRLSELLFNTGETTKALDVAARWVTHDQLNEAAHRRVMQAHLTAGDRAAALQAYAACRQTLHAELDVEPSPETEALAARARALAEATDRSSSAIRPVQVNIEPVSATGETPLVGRVNEFGTLVEAFFRIRRGQTEVVVVEGEAGIGKTRLATEFTRWSTAQGADVLDGRAYEAGGQLPYGALVDALGRRLDRENAPDDLLGNVWLAELSRLLPDVRERYPDLPAWFADDSAAQARLFEAVARLGQAFARKATLVLFVDDLQWADRASLDLLGYVARRWRDRRVPTALLFTVRAEDLAVSRPLADWLRDLERELRVTRVSLRSLTSADTLRLLEGIGVREHVETLAPWLFDETQGHPFYALESIRALIDRGVLTRHGEPGDGVEYDVALSALEQARTLPVLPLGVRQIIGARLSKLGPAATDLLVASAVLGQRSGFAPLCQVAGLGDDAGLRALDEALRLQLLRETRIGTAPIAQSTYEFTHDKIRDVVYTDAGDARRRVFHRRAVDALRGAGVPAAELAHHAMAATMHDEAFQFSLSAGEDALQVFATRDAIDHFQRALRLGVDHPEMVDPHLEPIGRLYLQLGRAFELVSEWGNALQTYETLLIRARETGQRPTECAALNRLATLTAQGATDADRATALLYQARAIAESCGDDLGLAETEWNLAQLGVYTLTPTMTFEHGERAIALARALGNQDLIARSTNALAYALRNVGRWEQGAARAKEAADLYAVLGNRALEVDSLALVGNSRVKFGQLWSGIDASRQALAMSNEIENPWGQIASAYLLVPGLLDAGLYAEALEVASRGMTIARAQATRPMLIFSLVELGATKRALGALDEAIEIHLEALALSEDLPGNFRESSAAGLCADYALAGRWDEAYTAASQALDARNSALLHTGFTRWAETEALVRAGDFERAERDALHFGEQVSGNRRFRIPFLRALAVLAQARGDISDVIRHLDEAAALAREIGLPGELWSIDLALAEACRTSGDEPRASEASARVRSTIQSLADNLDGELQASFLARSNTLTREKISPKGN